MPIDNIWFYIAAIPAVFIVGMSKGGLGGTGAVFGVPILALVISPIQAAAIMLPVMIVMDIVGVTAWRAKFDRKIFQFMMPGAILGIWLGWFFASNLSSDWIKFAVGLIAIIYVVNARFGKTKDHKPPQSHNPVTGSFWGAASGLTSFVAHAGAPPYQIYTLPLKLEPIHYASTAICFFAVVNAIKLVPYFSLGQFDSTNLMTSLVLLPLAPISTLVGVWAVKRINKATFYLMMDFLLFILGLYLVLQGVSYLNVTPNSSI